MKPQNIVNHTVKKYSEGVSLGKWMKSRGRTDLPDFFKISCAIATIVKNMHEAGSLHGGIKPENILIEPETLDIRLIDPVRVVDSSEISRYIHDDNFRINTLCYIAPEQTGRIKQPIDYPTDLYSLGIIFYELLNGAPSFESEDPLAVIHSHLAEIPNHLSTLNPDIPEMIGNIVAGLMFKEPEKRYQTGAGLLRDLIQCRDEYLRNGEILSFPLGLSDYSGKIAVSSIMVGREKQKELLLEEYSLSCSGNFRAVLISGLPGIGKTRLVRELEIFIASGRGYFTSGKFDQYQKNVPYSTLIQAFRELMDVFLTEAADRIEYWKKTITNALEPNGKLITNLIPALELIIDVQPKVADLPPTESKSRFNDLIARFLSCLAGPEHPLTLFIDDLQWCDRATFEILENIIINSKDYPYLFFLGAYRHNEVDTGHPLINLLENAREIRSPLTEIRLNAFEFVHANELISNFLGQSPGQTQALTEFVNQTSEGNPLYMSEMLTWFFENDMIYPGKDGAFQWDTEKITKSPVPDSLAELLRTKILKIPEDTLKVLQIAACLGVKFRIGDLSRVTNRDQADIYRALAPVFSQRILIKKEDFLLFFHDRVQEAMDSTLNEKTRRAIHARIAEAYIEAIPHGSDLESLDNLFSLVEHLNNGMSDFPDSKILDRDARFNYHAGRKAVESLALVAANQYFRKSMALIPEDCWETDYTFAFSLYKHSARSELTLGNQERVEELLNELIKMSKTDLDRAECLAEQSTNLLSLGEFKQSILAANQGLAYFNKAIPEDDSDVVQTTDHLAAAIKKAGVFPHEISAKNPISKRDELIEITLYNQLIPAYYLTGQTRKFFLTGIQAAHKCLFIGIHDQVIYPFAIYSIYLFDQSHYEDAFSLEGLVIELCNRFPNTFGETRGMNCVAWLSLHWQNSLSDVFNYSLKAVESGKKSGDTYHAGLAYCAAFWTAAMKGGDLRTVDKYVVECDEFSRKYNVPFSSGMGKGLLASWVEPMKGTGMQIPIKKNIDAWLHSADFALLGNYYIFSGMAQYYLGNFKDAADHFENGKKHLGSHTSNIPHRIWHIFFVLNSLRLLGAVPTKSKIDAMMTEIKPVLSKIELWAGFGPALKPYLAFIEAEIKSVKGDFSETRSLYLDAIDTAHEQDYTLLEGHIHEGLGALLLERGIRQARFHMNEAANLYEKCHAGAKLKLVRGKYPEYIAPIYEEKPEQVDPAQFLDAEYLMRTTRAIYQELDIDELLKVVMRLLMERSGASEGYLLMKEGGELATRIKGEKEKGIRVTLTDERLSGGTGFSRAMVRYAQRTKMPLILENATEEGPYSSDAEVRGLKLVSVFIHPIMRQQAFVGLICLQNNLIKAAFTEEQIEIVRLLSMHAAVAMENAALVGDMKKAERTIKEREALLRQSQELSRMASWDWHFADNSITWAGDVVSLFGRSADEMTHFDSFIDSIHTEDVEKVRQELQKSIDTTTNYRSEFRVIHPDGTVIWLLGQGGAKYDNDGQATNLAGMVVDITERKLAEKALKVSEEKYRSLVESALTGILIIDENHKLTYSNDAACQLLGRDREEIMGLDSRDCIDEETEKLVADHYDRRQRGEIVPLRYGFNVIRKNGEKRRAEVSLVTVRNSAGNPMTLVHMTDITERIQAEAALIEYRDHLEELVKERTEKLAKANEELKDFAYIVSHDLKAPLRGISQLAGWLMEDYASAFDEAGKEQMNMLINRTKRMHDMIEGILQYSRIGRVAGKKTHVDLNLLVNEIIEIISPPENIKIVVINNLPETYCDETEIYQVFQNLLDNAVKYMDKPEGRITVGAADEGGHRHFCISDNGPGIADRHGEKIFQLFQTLRPKDEKESTGIGLALVKKIVNKWGGNIRLESELGKGARFVFTIPKKEAPDEKQKTDTVGRR